MADTLTLFSKGGGYPQYTPIEPETFKIENTEFSFDLPKSYKDNTEALKLTSTPVATKPLQLTPIAKTAQSGTTMSAVATTSPNISVDTKKLELSKEVVQKATTPAEKAANYLNRAQFATGVESAAQIAQGIITLSNANAGVDAVERTGLCYQVGFNRRFDHNFRAVRQAVAAGKIGTPQLIKITSRDPEPPGPDYIRVSGGLFMDMMIHDFDMVRYLAGCNAAELYAEAAVLVDPAIGEAGDVDTAIVTLKMENGALAVIDNSRRAVYGYDQRCEVFGSAGMAASGNDAPSTLQLSTARGVCAEKPLWFFLERYTQAYADELRSFVSAITARTPAEVTADDGLQSVRMAMAAKRSLLERRPVRLDEIPE